MLWSIWNQLSLLAHGFVLMLGAVCAYSLFSATTTILRLRSIRNPPNENIVLIEQPLAVLRDRWARLRQVTTAALYLFGLVLSISLYGVASDFLGSGPHSIAMEFLGGFRLLCVFTTNVFFVFFVLHLVQWFVCGLLNSASGRSNAHLRSQRG
jgi:hypothetical protein